MDRLNISIDLDKLPKNIREILINLDSEQEIEELVQVSLINYLTSSKSVLNEDLLSDMFNLLLDIREGTTDLKTVLESRSLVTTQSTALPELPSNSVPKVIPFVKPKVERENTKVEYSSCEGFNLEVLKKLKGR